MKKILICGATGFIGRNCVEYFSKNDNYEVIAVYHQRPQYEIANVKWVQVDLREATGLSKLMDDVDIIIQAAATTSGAKDILATPYIHVTDNAVMNSLLLRAAFKHEIEHFIFFSCSIMYESSTVSAKENDFTGKISNKYFAAGWTKIYIEKMCEFYASFGKTKHTVIRHSNIYGSYDKFDLDKGHVFGASLAKVMMAEKEITVWGSGEESRDLLYIDDLLCFIEAAINKQKQYFSLYNCGLGGAISVKNLVQKIITLSAKKISITHDLSKPTIPYSIALDCKKAEKELGWLPQTTLNDGINKVIDWYRKNIDAQLNK